MPHPKRVSPGRPANRRGFLRGALATAALGPWLHACVGDAEAPLDTFEETPGDPLARGFVRGYKGLAELPYFEWDPTLQLLRLTVDDLPPGVDFHAHLGFTFFLSPRIDYLRSTERTHYLIDCDAFDPACAVNFDRYLNTIARPEMLSRMQEEIRDGLFAISEAAQTHTLPNLLREMDALNVEHAVLHAVAPNVPRNNVLPAWHDAVVAAGVEDRFTLFGSVHPKEAGALEKLRRQHADYGIRGIKMHPTQQQVAPDDPDAMALYEVCDELGIDVFYHAGRAGIEIPSTRAFALAPGYDAPPREFPNVRFIFGHAGARDYEQFIPVAERHDNVWLDLHGQGVPGIRAWLASNVPPNRFFYGADYPFYPLAAPLSRILIATEGEPEIRRMIFRDNAVAFLNLA